MNTSIMMTLFLSLLFKPIRPLPPAPHVEGWRSCWSSCPEKVHHPTPPCPRADHPSTHQVLPQGPDQAGQIPPGVQLPVPVLGTSGQSSHYLYIFINNS